MLRAQLKSVARHLLARTTSGRMLWRGPTTARRIAITFDDGPGELTEAYLEVLARYGAASTFFLMGNYVESMPGIVSTYIRGGHQVAGHGYNHERFTRLGIRALRDELTRMERALGSLPWGKWVRPPHGSLGARDVSVMLSRGYTVAMWSLDSKDYDGATAEVLIERCRPSNLSAGEVLLFHESNPATLSALPTILERLRDDGYEFVTMADLFSA